MTEFAASLPAGQEATEVKQVPSVSEEDSPRPLLLNPELEPRATSASGTITGTIHSLPREETWQLKNAAFIFHVYSN